MGFLQDLDDLDWIPWLKGVVAGLASGAWTGGASLIIDHQHGMDDAWKYALAGAASGALLYLKKSPLPDKKTTVTVTAAITTSETTTTKGE